MKTLSSASTSAALSVFINLEDDAGVAIGGFADFVFGGGAEHLRDLVECDDHRKRRDGGDPHAHDRGQAVGAIRDQPVDEDRVQRIRADHSHREHPADDQRSGDPVTRTERGRVRRDLARRLESEAEEQSDRYREQCARPLAQTFRQQRRLRACDPRAAGSQRAHVHRGDEQQHDDRDPGADQLDRGAVCCEARSEQADQRGDREDHHGVPAGKERADEAAEQRRLHVGVSRHVVDRREVVGIRSVAHAEDEDGERAEGDHAWTSAGR